MITIAMANAKGGVGKTSSAVHLATGLARYRDAKVLLIDLDPQCNTTTWLLGEIPPETPGTYEVLTKGADLKAHAQYIEERGIYLLPATPRLAAADMELAHQMGGPFVLQDRIEAAGALLDYTIIDCPPNLGIKVGAAICASDYVLSPILPSFFSLDGVGKLETAIGLAQKRYHAKTKLLGYFLFGADAQELVTKETREVLKERYPNQVLHTMIRVSTRAKSLPAGKLLSWDEGYDPRGKTDYYELLKEVTARLEA
jgi:chromosome partitioning protein